MGCLRDRRTLGDRGSDVACGVVRDGPGRSRPATLGLKVLHIDGKANLKNAVSTRGPGPTVFLERKFPICSIIRPTQTVGAAVGAVKGLAASGLFTGQSQEFFTAATALATAADAATRS
jgi:hypothetical protein